MSRQIGNRRSKNGAVSTHRKPPGLWPYFKTVCLAILAVALLGGAGVGATEFFAYLDKPVAVIAVQGEFRYVGREHVAALVEGHLKGGFLSLDLERIRHQLEQDPWIESAAVGRRWPDELVIDIVEETPIARWNNHSFLNSRGEALAISDNSRLRQLPLLLGPEGATREVMTQYRHAAQLLLPAGLKTMEFRLDQRKAWRLRVSGRGIDGLEIDVGQGDVTDKLKRFLMVYDAVLRSRKAEIARIDVRYPNGVAVSWRGTPGTGRFAPKNHAMVARGDINISGNGAGAGLVAVASGVMRQASDLL